MCARSDARLPERMVVVVEQRRPLEVGTDQGVTWSELFGVDGWVVVVTSAPVDEDSVVGISGT